MACTEAPSASFEMQHELVVASFLGFVWAMEKVFARFLQASPLLGQVVAGVVAGPALLDVIPYTAAFKFIGKLGVLLLVIESGLAVDIGTVRKIGARASLAALAGVVGPVLLSLLLLTVGLGESWKVGIAAGAALAPTSLGFSAQLLAEVGQARSPTGQLICTACVIDDVLSLMVLAEIQAFQGESVTAVDLVIPLIASLGTIIVGAALAVWLSPLMPKLVTKLPSKHPDNALLTLIIASCTVIAFLCRLAGSSDLLGCFVGGLLFSSLKPASRVWQQQMKRFTRWGTTMFFACTIAFEVPSLTGSASMFALPSLWRGGLLTLVALVGKFSTGFFAKPLSWTSFNVLGWAMQGRGEFSLLLAAEATADGIVSPTLSSAIVLAVLVASFMSPFGFRHFLRKQAHLPAPQPSLGGNDAAAMDESVLAPLPLATVGSPAPDATANDPSSDNLAPPASQQHVELELADIDGVVGNDAAVAHPVASNSGEDERNSTGEAVATGSVGASDAAPAQGV